MADELLIDQSTYLEAGVHIGTKVKTPGIKKLFTRLGKMAFIF